MVKNSTNYEIISRNSDPSKKLSVLVPSEDTKTPSAEHEPVTSLVRNNENEKLNWNFFEHFDQVDNQLRIEVRLN